MGVELRTIKPGDGMTFPKHGQIVVIHYTGQLPDGTVIDSSRDRNEVFKFKIGQGLVLKGWDEGIKMMSVGERAKMICSADYAYGKKGFPGVVPSNCPLIFDIELKALE